MSFQSLESMLVDRAVERLTAAVEEQIALEDDTRVKTVRAGLLQSDPTLGVSILVQINDPDSEGKWVHSVLSDLRADRETIINRNIAYELGGAELWWYRYLAQIFQSWRPNVDRVKARRFSSMVLAQSKRALKEMLQPNSVGPDDFGEYAIDVRLVSIENIEAGGPAAFMWRSKIYYQVLVGIP